MISHISLQRLILRYSSVIWENHNAIDAQKLACLVLDKSVGVFSSISCQPLTLHVSTEIVNLRVELALVEIGGSEILLNLLREKDFDHDIISRKKIFIVHLA